MSKLKRLPVTRRDDSADAADQSVLRELCHELTGSATSIRLLAQVAAMEPELGPAMRIRLRQIGDEAGLITDICRYFLDQSGGACPIGLDILAGDVVSSTRTRQTAVIDVVTEAVAVQVHPVVIVRILTNLLDNACRAAGPRGQVRLVVERAGDQARLVVADSGQGFGHGEAGKASLGLDIIDTLVRNSRGALSMGTSDLGGLAVTVTLPGASRPETPPDASYPGPASASHRAERQSERGSEPASGPAEKEPRPE